MRNASEPDGARPNRFFKLNPNFDLTGVAVVEGLSANTTYSYQVGWIFSDLDSAQLDLEAALEWEGLFEYSFTTPPDDQRERSFVFGSCRYLLRLFGGTVFDSRGDKTFRTILQQLEAGRQTDALLMVGDQIYADDLNFLHADTSVDQFYARYRDAFTSPQLRLLMSRVPTYMTLDDHEIEDNWPRSADGADYARKFPAAIHAYQTYQLSHSPIFPVKNGRLEGTLDALWYTFRDGTAEFFMADTRTERHLAGQHPQMIGTAQLEALKFWLSNGSGCVKFIASGVPPFAASGDDKWDGFIEQRDLILDFIQQAEIRRVVFLSGDVHASFTSELGADTDPQFKVFSIVSSAFFWPYPHPMRGQFQESGPIKSNSKNSYRILNRSSVVVTDNFTRVTANRETLLVEVFTRKGDLADQTRHSF